MLPEIKNTNPLAVYPIKDGVTIAENDIVGLDDNGDAVHADFSAAVNVIGLAEYISDDATEVTVKAGIFLFADISLQKPVTRNDRGCAVTLEGLNYIAKTSALESWPINPAGILVDVTDDGAWVDMRPDAIAAATALFAAAAQDTRITALENA